MENRRRKIGWKTVFSNVWQKKENEEEGKLGRKFSPKPTIFILPIGRKRLERKVLARHFYTNTSFWNQVKKKKKEGESAGEKKERMRAVLANARTFLNEEEKENKRRGIEIRTTCVEEKKKKKKNVWMK